MPTDVSRRGEALPDGRAAFPSLGARPACQPGPAASPDATAAPDTTRHHATNRRSTTALPVAQSIALTARGARLRAAFAGLKPFNAEEVFSQHRCQGKCVRRPTPLPPCLDCTRTAKSQILVSQMLHVACPGTKRCKRSQKPSRAK